MSVNGYITKEQVRTLLQNLKGELDTKALNSDLEQHIEAVNPHNITKTTIGLENVDNTADLDKPISTATQSALDGKINVGDVESGAQVNTIESISLNGTQNIIQPDVNKNVNIEVITNAVDDLINYYKKNETYTQSEVNNLIGAITTLDIRVVNELPTEDISTTTIYLVPAEDPGTQNIKDEYINLTGTTEGWEKIGSTEIDLSNYYTKDEVNTLIGQIDLSVFYTKTETDNLLSSKADLVNGKVPLSELPNIPGKQEVFVFESKDDFPVQGEIDTLYISQESGKSYIWEVVSNEYTFSGSYCTINNVGGVEAPVTMEATITDWYYPTAPASTWVGFQNNSYPSTEPPYIGVAFDTVMAKIGKTAPIAGDKITFYKYNGVTSIIYNSEGTDYDVSDCLYVTGGTTYGHDLYIVANVNQQFSGIFAGPGAATYRGYQNLERYKVISGEMVQSDWDQETDSAPDYIKNKPVLGTAAYENIPESGNASATEVVMGNDTRLTDARTPAAHTHVLADITDYDYLDPNNYTSYNNLVLTAEPKLKYLYKVNGEIQDGNNYIRNISELYSCIENNTEPISINADLYGNRNCVITNTTAEGHTDKPLVLVIKSANGEDITIPNGYINFTFHVQLNPNEGATIVNNINGTTIKNIIGSTTLKADERIIIYTGDSVAFLLKPDKTKINMSEALVITRPYILTTENIITVTVEGQSFAKAQYIEWDNSNIKIDKIYDGYLKDIEFGNYLYSKVTSSVTQNQVDWEQDTETAEDYIKNKPDLSTKADKVQNVEKAGRLAGLDATGNLVDSGINADNVAKTIGNQQIYGIKTFKNGIVSEDDIILDDSSIATKDLTFNLLKGYKVGDPVVVFNELYRCIIDHPAGQEWTYDHFEKADNDIAISGNISANNIKNIESTINSLSDSYLEKVSEMPVNPSNGDIVIWNGDSTYTLGHVYKYVSSGSGETLYAWTIDNPGDWSDGVIIYTKLEEPTYEDMEVYKSDGTQYSYLTDDPSYTCDGYQEGYNCISVEIRDEATGNTEERSANRTPSEDITPSAGKWVEVSSNVQSDWNQNDPTANDYIKNKPPLGNGLPIVIEMPENPTDGQLVVWGGGADYTEGHTYRYDENKEEWVDVIEDYIYNVDWASQGDVSFTGRQLFTGHVMFTDGDGPVGAQAEFNYPPTFNHGAYFGFDSSEDRIAFGSSGSYYIDEYVNANFNTVTASTITTSEIQPNDSINGITCMSDIDMNYNDLENINNANANSFGVNTLSSNGNSEITMGSDLDFDSQYNINNASSISTEELYVSSITGQDNNILVNNPIEINNESSGTSAYYKYNGINGDDFNIEVNHLYYNNEEVATKSDLQNLATKSDLQNLATKSDLQNLYTSNIYGIEDEDIIINNNIDLDGNDILNADIINSNTIQANSTKSPKMGYAEYFKALKASNVVPYRFVKINETNSNYIELSQADGSNPYIGISATNAMIIGNNNQTVTSSEENILVGLTGSFWIDIYEDENIVPGNFVAPEDGGYASKTTQQFYPQVIKVDSVNNRCLVLLK